MAWRSQDYRGHNHQKAAWSRPVAAVAIRWATLRPREPLVNATMAERLAGCASTKFLTDSVVCRGSTFAMPDNVGINRQLNRQQVALVVCVPRCWRISVLHSNIRSNDVRGT